MFGKAVLSDAYVFSGGFDAEIIANCWPKFIFPGDEVIFNAEKCKRNLFRLIIIKILFQCYRKP